MDGWGPKQEAEALVTTTTGVIHTFMTNLSIHIFRAKTHTANGFKLFKKAWESLDDLLILFGFHVL